MTPLEQQTFLIENLRDLHRPTDSLWWPLADGWWITGAIVTVILLWALYRIYKKYIQPLLMRRALTLDASVETLLSRCHEEWQLNRDNVAYIHCVSLLLRKAAIASAGRSAIAKLNGVTWVHWLEQTSGQTFSADAKLLLARGPYELAPPPPNAKIHSEVDQCLKQLVKHNYSTSPLVNRQVPGNA